MKNAFERLIFLAILSAFSTICGSSICMAQTDSTITISTLMDEMVSAESDVTFPSLNYSAKQLTSYDRRSLTPGTPNWHANDDWSGFIRTETNNGRVEKVLFDGIGPGAITRVITTGGSGTANLRMYFDGETEASILIRGYDISKFPVTVPAGLFYKHEHYPTTQGCSFFYPIPYARRCKITVDDINRGYVYHVNYRTYDAGTQVKTFSLGEAKDLQQKAVETGYKLLHPQNDAEGKLESGKELAAGESLQLDLPSGTKAIRTLTFQVSAFNQEEYAQLMRGLIVKLSFDSTQTVWAPLSDFSGAGMGAPKVDSWYLSADGAGKVVLRFTMPYKRNARIELENVTKFKATVNVMANVSDWNWKKNTLYFHATWRQERELQTNAGLDYNMATLTGRGIFKGDVLSLYNHCSRWYGEGDEHIWIDNERFPSHFGCGTEDYYNSTYAPIHVYFNPFGGAPREDDETSHGYNTFVRTRNLDVIPFNQKLKFEFELISWDGGLVDYASTVYWYGDLDSKALNSSSNDEALQTLPLNTDIKMEAESGTVGGGAVKSSYSSASGGYQVGMMDNVGAHFQVTANVPTAGTKTLVIIYSNGMGDTRHKSLYINGVKIGQLALSSTGGWSNYGALSINVHLNAGNNILKIQRDAEDDTATDFDYLLLSSQSLNDQTSGINITKKEQSGFELYPNPVNNTLYIVAKAPCNLKLSDISGKVVLSKKMENTTADIDLSDLPKSVFLLWATNNNGDSFVRKIVKN